MSNGQIGIVFNIQKFCLNDGPGIRTTIFLKGCNLRCQWCHNPESFKINPELSYQKWKCTHCGSCVEVCPKGVHKVENNVHKVERHKCDTCGICEKTCPTNALKVIGQRMTVDEVMQEVLEDQRYYDESGGGVTFSGGEATVQFDFLKLLSEQCNHHNIHTVLETNGLINSDKLAELSGFINIVLFDYKLSSDLAYRQLTGYDNQLILENLRLLKELNKEVILRCPIIPGINDTLVHFEKIKNIKENYSNITAVELMPYHDMGKAKWENIGLNYQLDDLKTVSREQKKVWENYIR